MGLPCLKAGRALQGSAEIKITSCDFYFFNNFFKIIDLVTLCIHAQPKYDKFGFAAPTIPKPKANTQKIVKVSSIYFELLETECYETEEAIEKLLDKLSEDKQGIKELIKHSNAVIEICKNQYVSANAGMAFSKELLQRLSEFEIGIDIDTYICGKEFIS